jgi:hypothetical protein
MRIVGPNGVTVSSSASAPKRSNNGSFSLGEAPAAQNSAATSATRSVGGIEALMALQGVEDPTERRRRAVSRGRTALDALDGLKVGLLSGALDEATLGRLRMAATGLRDVSGDPRLDGVLAEIELRVEVELAKMASLAA